MNVKKDLLDPFDGLTIKELTEVTQGLLLDALDAASVSRTLKLRILDDSFNVPLARDLLLSWVSQAMEVRAQLQFWTEMNGYASGLQVQTIGTDFTHGSVLAMELIEYTILTVKYTEALKSLIIDANSPD